MGSWPYENAPADKFACPRIGDTGRSAQAASANQQRKRIKCKFTREGAVEKFEPLLLRSERQLFPGLRAFVFELPKILQVVNHLVHEQGLFRGRYAGPPFRQIDCPVRVVIDSDDVSPHVQRHALVASRAAIT